jgi:hypothetical protein
MIVIHRKVSFCTIIKGVKFLPGMNSLSDGEMAKVAETAAFKSEITCGNMLIGGTYKSETSDATEADTSKVRAGKLAREILSMTAKEAATMIGSMNDAFVLKAVKEADGRTGVQEAVDARIKSIQSQEGSDLVPETKVAPEGSGSDFAGDITGSKDDLEGTKAHTAIPALKPAGKK